jgi:hypothetical protein
LYLTGWLNGNQHHGQLGTVFVDSRRDRDAMAVGMGLIRLYSRDRNRHPSIGTNEPDL